MIFFFKRSIYLKVMEGGRGQEMDLSNGHRSRVLELHPGPPHVARALGLRLTLSLQMA